MKCSFLNEFSDSNTTKTSTQYIYFFWKNTSSMSFSCHYRRDQNFNHAIKKSMLTLIQLFWYFVRIIEIVPKIFCFLVFPLVYVSRSVAVYKNFLFVHLIFLILIMQINCGKLIWFISEAFSKEKKASKSGWQKHSLPKCSLNC